MRPKAAFLRRWPQAGLHHDLEALTRRFEEGFFCRGELGAVVAAREQVAVAICGHRDRGMAEPGLDQL